MAKRNNRKRPPTEEEDSGTAKKTRGDTSPNRRIADVAKNLQNLLAERERELDEREEAFERQVALFEKSNPQAGRKSDVLHLNVGGATNIAVSRATLTQFEDSMLASKFSGRWDDSLEKDKEGNIFIDADPDLFLCLLSYLRTHAQHKRSDIAIPPPKPSFKFCCMLEYYGLLPAIYPQSWKSTFGSFSRTEGSYGAVTLFSKKRTGALCTFTKEPGGLKISSLTILVERGTTAQIGWSACMDPNFNNAAILLIDVNQRRIMSRGTVLQQDLPLQIQREDVVIHCSRHGSLCKLQVEGMDEDGQAETDVSRFGDLHVGVAFTGKVTVSNVQYAY